MEANRKRSIRMRFYVTPEERRIIEEKMALLGTANLSAYLRKMALVLASGENSQFGSGDFNHFSVG